MNTQQSWAHLGLPARFPHSNRWHANTVVIKVWNCKRETPSENSILLNWKQIINHRSVINYTSRLPRCGVWTRHWHWEIPPWERISGRDPKLCSSRSGGRRRGEREIPPFILPGFSLSPLLLLFSQLQRPEHLCPPLSKGPFGLAFASPEAFNSKKGDETQSKTPPPKKSEVA